MKPEQKQQLISEIEARQRQRRLNNFHYDTAVAVRDVDELLSLVKSQEAGGGFGGPCSACGDGDIEMKYHTHNRKGAIHAEDISSDSDHSVRAGVVATSAVAPESLTLQEQEAKQS